MSRLVLLAIGSLALVTGCTVGEGSRPPREAALVLRTGEGCARGCAIDRPLLVGTEEIADVVGTLDPGALSVSVEDPSIATAWIENVRMCCDAGACRAMHPAEIACAGSASEQPRVVIRALRPGRTLIELGDGRAWEPIEISDAAVIEALDAVPGSDRFDGDVIGRTIAPWIDGRIEQIALRAGQVAYVRFVVFDGQGRRLHASAGIGARVEDPAIAQVGLPGGACDGTVAVGEVIAIEGESVGATTLSVRAGTAGGTLALAVVGACRDGGSLVLSSDACESDADCAPVECCHAAACGAVRSAPSCDGVFCTLECREATLDCGGRCLCVEGRCAAYLAGTHDPTCAPTDPRQPLPPVDPPF